MNLLVGCDGPK